jgi:hypothetical protein
LGGLGNKAISYKNGIAVSRPFWYRFLSLAIRFFIFFISYKFWYRVWYRFWYRRDTNDTGIASFFTLRYQGKSIAGIALFIISGYSIY